MMLVPVLGCGAPEATDGDTGPGDAGTSAAETATETGGGAEGDFVPLVDHALWQMLDGAADPLADHRPATVECGLAGWYVEDEQLEVDTNFCNYLGLAQPGLAAIEQGKRVRLGLYYFDLVAPEPAMGHVAILVDGQVLWEDEIEIPGPAKVFDLEFESPLTAELGAEVVFHLHNHGQNTWVLQSVSVEQ
jgi:hypothetical protein